MKSEDEAIKIVLMVRDSKETNVFRSQEEIKDVLGEGVFEDDLAAIIMIEDLST